MNSIISADDHWIIWASLVSVTALSIYLEQKFRIVQKITGTLSHWHCNTFIASWNHRLWKESHVNFRINEQGKVIRFTISIRPDWIDTREYVFDRIR